MALKALFTQEEYPPDLMGFYGQGYSVSKFLVEIGGRPRFLKFVRDGMRQGWDAPPDRITAWPTAGNSIAPGGPGTPSPTEPAPPPTPDRPPWSSCQSAEEPVASR